MSDASVSKAGGAGPRGLSREEIAKRARRKS